MPAAGRVSHVTTCAITNVRRVDRCETRRSTRCAANAGDVSLTLATTTSYALAGGLGCFISHGLSVPLDVIKTRLQVQSFEDESVIAVGREIVRRDGVGALLDGWESTFAGYFIQGACKYGFFEVFKALSGVNSGGSADDHRLLTLLLCAASAEVIGSAFLTPLEQIRIKTVSDASYASDGFFEAAKKFAREEGMDGIIQSLPVTYAKMVPYTAVQLASFEVLKVALADVGDASVIKTSSAVLAGIAASLSSQPGDTLLSVRNSGSLNAAVTTADSLGADAAVMAPESVFDTIIRLGPAGLMTGWRARLVHVTTIVVVQLLVYDSIKSALLSRVG